MFQFCWMLCISFMSISLELMLSRFGLIFPSALFLLYYIGISYRLQTAVFFAMAVAVVVELYLGRHQTSLPLILPFALVIFYFKKYGDRTSVLIPIFMGFVFAGVNSSFLFVYDYVSLRGFYISYTGMLKMIAYSSIASAIIFPVAIYCLDLLADKMELYLYEREVSHI